MSLRLHPKHGVNPTIPRCYLCGENKNEVVLLGNAYKDQAPMNMCLDKSPCDKCRDYMRQGIILIGVRDGEQGDNPYRTGNFCVLKEEAVKRAFKRALKDCEGILKSRVAFVDETTWEALGLPVVKFK